MKEGVLFVGEPKQPVEAFLNKLSHMLERHETRIGASANVIYVNPNEAELLALRAVDGVRICPDRLVPRHHFFVCSDPGIEPEAALTFEFAPAQDEVPA